MKREDMKLISKLLVMTMVMTIALPQGVGKSYKKTVAVNAAAREVSTTDIKGNEEIPTGKLPIAETTEAPTGETTSGETTTTQQPTTEAPTINPDFVVSNGVLVQYKKGADDKTNKEVEIPACVTKIDNKVFNGYKYIENIKFEKGSLISEIGDNVFEGCTTLKSIELPEGLKSIGTETFKNCSVLAQITIPSTMETIGKRAFYGCSAIKTLTLPEGLETIKYHAFYNMKGITSLTIPSTVTYAYEILGSKSNVTKVVFAQGMVTIPDRVLQYATSVKTITMYKGVTAIGASAFKGCTNLTGNDTVSTVKKIGNEAYRDCTSLKRLTLYKAVKSIGEDTFTGDTKLVLKVYSNSYGKAYARKKNISWKYKASEVARMTEDKRVYNQLVSKTTAKYKGKFKLQNLSSYTPQGTCVIGKYIVISMYHKSLKKNSKLVIYDKSGNWVKTLNLTVKDHVGSVTNIKNNLLVGLNNVPGSKDQVGVITYSALKKAKNGKTIKFKYKLKLAGCADFAAYDGTYYWAGRSANATNCLMYGYKVSISKKGKISLKNKYNLYVPANTQGLIVKKESASKRTFTISQSYGRTADSYLMEYKSVNIKSAATLGNPTKKVVLPSMLEGITMYGTKILMVYESGAGQYCSNPDNTSEIQVKNLYAIKYTTLLKLK